MWGTIALGAVVLLAAGCGKALGPGRETVSDAGSDDAGPISEEQDLNRAYYFVAPPENGFTKEEPFRYTYTTDGPLNNVRVQLRLINNEALNPQNRDEVPGFPPEGQFAVPLFIQPDLQDASKPVTALVTIPRPQEEYSYNLSFHNAGMDQVTAYCQTVPGANSYRLEYSDGNRSYSVNFNADPSQREFSTLVEGLSPATQYTFLLGAYDSDSGDVIGASAQTELIPLRTHWASNKWQFPNFFGTGVPDTSGLELEVNAGSTYVQVCHPQVPGAAIYEHSISLQGEKKPLESELNTNNCITFTRIPGDLTPGNTYEVAVTAYRGWLLDPDYYQGIDLSNENNRVPLSLTSLSYQIVNEDTLGHEEEVDITERCKDLVAGCGIELDSLPGGSLVIEGTVRLTFPSFMGHNPQTHYDRYNPHGKAGFVFEAQARADALAFTEETDGGETR